MSQKRYFRNCYGKNIQKNGFNTLEFKTEYQCGCSETVIPGVDGDSAMEKYNSQCKECKTAVKKYEDEIEEVEKKYDGKFEELEKLRNDRLCIISTHLKQYICEDLIEIIMQNIEESEKYEGDIEKLKKERLKELLIKKLAMLDIYNKGTPYYPLPEESSGNTNYHKRKRARY